jgi:hypothetical protein
MARRSGDGNMCLRATVRSVTGKTRHLLGVQVAGEIKALPLPDPETVELVVEEDGTIFLLRFDDEGQCISDTWHETVEAAKAQANFEFGIEEGDWKEGEARH